MIVISLVLVVISAISLIIGGVFRDDLDLIYVSIAAALAAGLFLMLGVMRGSRRGKRVKAATLPGEDAAGKPATWQGSWGGPPAQDALARDDDEEGQSPVLSTTETVDETVRIDESAYAPPPPVDQTLEDPAAAEPTPVDAPGSPATPATAPAPPPTPPPTAPAGGWAPPPAPPPPASTPAVAPPAPPPAGPSRRSATPPPPPPP